MGVHKRPRIQRLHSLSGIPPNLIPAEPVKIVEKRVLPEFPAPPERSALASFNFDMRPIDKGRLTWERWIRQHGFVYLRTVTSSRFNKVPYDIYQGSDGVQVFECRTMLYWDLTTMD